MEDNNQLPPEELDSDKELDKQEQKEQKKEENKKTLKTVVTSVICTLLFIIILLLLILLCLKNCSGKGNNGQTSSEQPIDTETTAKINKSFLDIVKRQMLFDGYDTDELTSVVAVTYEDSDTTFDINIIASSESKVYFYYADDVNKGENINFVSYLLEYDTNQALDGDITLSFLEKSNAPIETSKSSYKGVISKSASEDKYLSGFTYEDNSFFIYLKRFIVEGNEPFTGVGDQKISSGEPLFDYYRGLLAQ